GRPGGGRVAAENVDRHTVVIVASPATRGFKGPPAGDHRACRHDLIVDLAVHASQPPNGCLKVAVVLGAWEEPLVEPVPPSPRPLSGLSLGPATNPSRDIDMYSTVEAIVSLLALIGTP